MNQYTLRIYCHVCCTNIGDLEDVIKPVLRDSVLIRRLRDAMEYHEGEPLHIEKLIEGGKNE